MKSLKIVVLGGTGFVGSHLVPRLQRDGHTLKVLSRNRDLHRELGVLPGVSVDNADVCDRADLIRHLAGADAAINLVGILNERGSDGSGFRKAHVELTETVIAACAASGVSRLLQMSALRAGEGDSHYLKTRGEAEARVKASALAWTIFRPSVIFGFGDGLPLREIVAHRAGAAARPRRCEVRTGLRRRCRRSVRARAGAQAYDRSRL